MPEPLRIVKREPLPTPPTPASPLEALQKAQTLTAGSPDPESPDFTLTPRYPAVREWATAPIGPVSEAARRLREWATQTEQLGTSGGDPTQARIGGFLAGAVGGMPEGAVKPSWMPDWLWSLSGGHGGGGVAGQVEAQGSPLNLATMLPFSHLPARLRGAIEPLAPAPAWEGLPGFYSPLVRTVENQQAKSLSVKKWLDVMKATPKAEREWKGVEPWLQAKVPAGQAADRVMVLKQDLLDYLATKKVTLKDIDYMRGTFAPPAGPAGPPHPQAQDFIGPVEDLGHNRFQIQFNHPDLRGHPAVWEQRGAFWRATVPAAFTPDIGDESLRQSLGIRYFDSEPEARAWVQEQLTDPEHTGYQALEEYANSLHPHPPSPALTSAAREYRTPQTPLNAAGYSLPNRVAKLWNTYRYKRLLMPGEIPENQLDPQAHEPSHSTPEFNRVVHVRSQNYLLPAQPIPPKWQVIDKATGKVIAEEWFPNEAEKTRLAGPGKGADREVAYVPGGTTNEPEMRGRSVEEVQSDWANEARGARNNEVARRTGIYARDAADAQAQALQADPTAPQRSQEDLEYEAGQRAEKDVPEHWGWKRPGDTLEAETRDARQLAKTARDQVLAQARAAHGQYTYPDNWAEPLRSEYARLDTRVNDLSSLEHTLRQRKPVMPFAGPYNPFGYVDLALKAELLDAAKRKGLEWIGIVGGSENAARYGSGYAFPFTGVKVAPRTGELHFQTSPNNLLAPDAIGRARPRLTPTSKAALDYLGPEELASLRQQHEAFLAAHPNQGPLDPAWQSAYVHQAYNYGASGYRYHPYGLPGNHPLEGQPFPTREAAEQAIAQAKATANPGYDPAYEDQAQWPSVTLPEPRLGPTQTGKGMYLAYDERYRHTLERLLAPFGGKLTQLRLVPGSSGRQAYLWMMQLTPEMKKKILASGFPLFTALAALQAAGAPDHVLDYVRARALERSQGQAPTR